MLAHINWHDPILINTIGHSAGLLLFGVVIVLLLRDSRVHGMRQIRLSLLAALLAFGWNAGSLFILASPNSPPMLTGIVVAASFSMLSLLPAVLFHVALQGKQRLLVIAGYVVSGCAIVLHCGELFSSGVLLHQAALASIVIGFAILSVWAFARRYREEAFFADRSQWISLGCLLLFTSSFLHFGYQHARSPWTAEIAWHHIGIPVVLILLLRDYRFLLLDTFVRFLVNSGLAVIYTVGILFANERFHLASAIRSRPFLAGIALVSFCLSLILFAYLRNALQAWVNRVIFRRGNIEEAVKTLLGLSSAARSEDELLARASQHVTEYFGTDDFAVVSGVNARDIPAAPGLLLREQNREELAREKLNAEAQIPLRFSTGNPRYLLLGGRRGGRRYLSDDLEDMRRLGAAIIEQVERFRADELKRLAGEAELRALQAQINPHFLFNALNTLYGTIDRRSPDARRIVLNLAEMFRYLLDSRPTVVPLRDELQIVKAYLEIESLRLGERLETELIIDESVESTLIPVLSIQPLVENSVRHGIAAKADAGRVRVRAEKIAAGLRIAIEDTGVGMEKSQIRSQNGTGLGLENVRRRLALCYGAAAGLEIESSAAGTTVTFLVPDARCAEETSLSYASADCR